MPLRDITHRNDIIRLVDTFYGKVVADTLLGPVFIHLDWNIHKPIMYDFWSTLLFAEVSYKGNPFQKHVHLDINASHFAKWLELFQQTVDELFEGDKAEEAKERARSIGGIFQHKLGLTEG